MAKVEVVILSHQPLREQRFVVTLQNSTVYEGRNVSAIAEEDAACVRSILAGRPERFRELVERY